MFDFNDVEDEDVKALIENLKGHTGQLFGDDVSIEGSTDGSRLLGLEFEEFIRKVLTQMLGFEEYKAHGISNRKFQISRIRIDFNSAINQGYLYKNIKSLLSKPTDYRVGNKIFNLQVDPERINNQIKIKVNSEIFYPKGKGRIVYEKDGSYVILNHENKIFYLDDKKPFIDGFFTICEKGLRFRYDSQSQSFLYGSDPNKDNDPSDLVFELTSEKVNNDQHLNNISLDIKRDLYNPLISISNSNVSKSTITKEDKGLFRIPKEREFPTLNYFLDIKKIDDTLIKRVELKKELEEIDFSTHLTITIDPTTFFEIDVIAKCPKSFPLDLRIFKPYLCDDIAENQDYSIPDDSLLVGEAKLYYDFPDAYSQLQQKLLFLRKILNHSNPIIGFLFFRASSTEHLPEQKSKIKDLEKDFNCKILVLFVPEDFIYVSFKDFAENNNINCLEKMLSDLEAKPENRLLILELMNIYLRKQSPRCSREVEKLLKNLIKDVKSNKDVSSNGSLETFIGKIRKKYLDREQYQKIDTDNRSLSGSKNNREESLRQSAEKKDKSKLLRKKRNREGDRVSRSHNHYNSRKKGH